MADPWSEFPVAPAETQQATSDPWAAFPQAGAAEPQKSDEKKPQGLMKTVDDYMAMAAKGLSFGLSDRIAAAGDSLIGRGSYDENLARNRALIKDVAERHPIASPVTETLAGMAGPIGAVGAIGRGATMLGKVGAGALAGSGLGAVQGAAEAQDFTNIGDSAKHAAIGGGVGAVIGGSIPLIARGVGAAYNAGADALRGRAEGISNPAASHLLRALQADDPTAVQGALKQLGPEAMLADAGPALLGKAQGAAINSDDGRAILGRALTDRRKAANSRIQGAVNDAIGPGEDPALVTQGILSHRSTVDAQNYGRALSSAPPVDTTAALAMIGQRLETAEGMEKKALLNLRDSLLQAKEVPVLNADGSQVMGNGPSVRNTPRTNDPLKGTKPRNLYDFIRDSGGVKDEHGELEALGLGKLVNPNGRSYDEARRYAAEQGYLGANVDDAIANTYTGDFFNALEKGKTVFSAYDTDRIGLTRKRPPGPDPTNGWSPGPQTPLVETKMVPKDRAENIHNIRQEIDNVINYGAPGLGVPAGALQNQQGALKQARSVIDAALKGQVPGFAEADAASSALAKRAEAVKLGTSLLDSGKTALTPDALRIQYEAMSPGERAALAKGLRGEIERQLDTKANDLVAGKNVIKGEGDWNRERLSTVFGPKATDRIIAKIDAEAKFNDTANKVVENSQTAQRTAAAREMKPEPSSQTPLINSGSTFFGTAATAAKMGGNKILEALKPDSTRFFGEIADVLSAQGGARDKHLSALVDALSRRQDNRQSAKAIEGRAALLSALLADAGRRRLSEKR